MKTCQGIVEIIKEIETSISPFQNSNLFINYLLILLRSCSIVVVLFYDEL